MSVKMGAGRLRRANASPVHVSPADRGGIAPYLFIAPFLLFFTVLFLGPALYSLFLSFTRYRGFGTPRWVGFDNYVVMLNYDAFWMMLRNSVFYWIAHSVPMMTIAFLLAVLVHSKLARWLRTFKAIIFLPQMLATVAAALLFQNFFGTRYGVIDSLLGIEIPWLTDPALAPWTVVAVLVWRDTGYWFVIFLAGLTTIDPEIDNAARIDGATELQRLIRITLPLMRPTLIFAVLVDAVVTLRLFAEPNVLSGRPGGLAPDAVAPVLNLIVQNIQGGQFGLAAAVGWLLFLVIAAISFVMFRIMRQRNAAS
jgi:ABC-type sugar transport system permease subunit